MSFYDHYADQQGTAAGTWLARAMARRTFRACRPFLGGEGAALLEIGPGAGELADEIRAAGFRNYSAIEPNQRIRERLAARGYSVRDGLVPPLDTPDAALDALLLSHVFEHMDGTRGAMAFLHEARRALRPGGLVVIASPDYLHWGADFFHGDYTHANLVTVRRLTQMFRDSGFETAFSTHTSGPFGEPLATPLSLAAGTALRWSRGQDNRSRWYKLKTTFLRSVLVVGRRRP
ncbi:MAG: class I SAM-dependent methyltransferase [Kiritimatiellia bacterium]